MPVILRPEYQQPIQDGIFQNWQLPRVDGKKGPCNVLVVAPTGAGKTMIMSSTVKNVDGPTVSTAHRQELVSQISLALAKNEIYHRIHASEAVIKFCITRHIDEVGANFHHDKAPDSVSGVKTLLNRANPLAQYLNSVRAWNTDEGHHMTPKNSWGQASLLMPNAFGVGFTASPLRADRQPLGRVNGGMYDYMTLGPSMRELIDTGFLSDYRLIAPPVSIDRSQIKLSEKTGELNLDSMRKASHKSKIVGDIVENYLKFAPGKRGIAFVVDIETAIDVAKKFNEAGVKAMAVSSKTPDKIRQDAIRRFGTGELTVLVNVDLFGEGFDVPAVEVVMMGRPTESFGLYLQQFGRALRVFAGKLYGIIIDHVGNYLRHGLPDAHRSWSLEADLRGTPRGIPDPNVLPLTRCTECWKAYEAITSTCPFCQHVSEPASRKGPQFVDGDLAEIDAETLAEMRGQVSNIQSWNSELSVHDDVVSRSKKINIQKRQTSQTELRDAIELWAGVQTQAHGRTTSNAYRIFYHKFGCDVLTAQSMKLPEMVKMTEEIRKEFI